jgi:hypothetical protein
MNVLKKTSILFLGLVFTGCASSPKETILQNMLIGAITGYALGQLKPENKQAHSLIYLGMGASLAAVGTLYLTDFDSSKELKNENQKLKSELDKIFQPSEKEDSSVPRVLIFENPALKSKSEI